MKKVLLICAFFKILLLVNGSVSSDIPFDVYPKKHLQIFQEYRNPVYSLVEPWINARKYIKEKFKDLGLSVETQRFNTTVATMNNSLVQVVGENIIAILRSRPSQKVLLVGVDYDTPLYGCPLRNSGAGVAAMIETATLFLSLRDLDKFDQTIDILFVAFDLTIKKYMPSSLELGGSSVFVNNWLPNYLIGREFLGAIILDSLGEYNLDKRSQLLTQGQSVTFPAAYQRISASGFMGDFLGLLTRDNFGSSSLKSLFSTRFSEESDDTDFRLQEFVLREGIHVDPLTFKFLSKSSQYAFWEAEKKPLSALLLTDMGATRESSDKDCINVCSVDKFWTTKRELFVERTTKAIIRALIDMQQPPTSEPEESCAPSCIYGTGVFITAILLAFQYHFSM